MYLLHYNCLLITLTSLIILHKTYLKHTFISVLSLIFISQSFIFPRNLILSQTLVDLNRGIYKIKRPHLTRRTLLMNSNSNKHRRPILLYALSAKEQIKTHYILFDRQSIEYYLSYYTVIIGYRCPCNKSNERNV